MDHVISSLAKNIAYTHGFVNLTRAVVNEKRHKHANLPVGYHDLVGAQIVSPNGARVLFQEPMYAPPVNEVCDCVENILLKWIPEWPQVRDGDSEDQRRLAEEIGVLKTKLINDCIKIRAAAAASGEGSSAGGGGGGLLLPDTVEKAEDDDLLRLFLSLTFRITTHLTYEFAYPIKNPIALLLNKLSLYLNLRGRAEELQTAKVNSFGYSAVTGGMCVMFGTILGALVRHVLSRGQR